MQSGGRSLSLKAVLGKLERCFCADIFLPNLWFLYFSRWVAWHLTEEDDSRSLVARQLFTEGKNFLFRQDFPGHHVNDDSNQKIGVIDDLIITPENAVSFAIIGAGGFLGVGRHDVAIPVSELKMGRDNVILPGATKDRIKAMPKFEYGKQ